MSCGFRKPVISRQFTPSLFKAWQAQQETAANAKAGEGGHTKEKKDDEEKKKKEKEEESWKEQ